ncbi:MAG: glycosyltransferase [Gemmatimonadetes bacterium]|nr:glycosyltransferase [Gemmatimonadota bacterium]
MTLPNPPSMSLIAITTGPYAILRRLIAHLRAQTIHDRLELVIAAPTRSELGLEESELAEFHSFKIVETGACLSNPAARAAAIRAAGASFVALTEEHSFPEPGWAEALLAAHDEGHSVVGPAILNANPLTLLSWANLLSEYGQWMERPKNDQIEHLPGHNSSYRREVLLEYGDDLEDKLEAESVIHWELRRRGLRLCLEPQARTRHLNVSRWSTTLRLRLSGGRNFAGSRARVWGIGRRLLYTAASPLIPFVRFRRVLRDLRRIRARQPVPRGVGIVLLGILMVDGLGEWMGYAFGTGDSVHVLTDLEFDRLDHMRHGDRETLDR